MNSIAWDVVAAIVRLSPAEAGALTSTLWPGGPAVSSVVLPLVATAAVALSLLAAFVRRGERWDQRRLRVWSRPWPAGKGRRENDLRTLEASINGPFRRKPSVA
jgi:hypothetical protein